MAVIPAFVKPDWLNGQDEKTIHRRMMDALPAGLDGTEGSFAWDFTRPTAMEKSEMLEFHLTEAIRVMHPMWAYGKWLDYHAAGVGLSRKAANAAYGMVRVTGLPETLIPAGFVFAVPAAGGMPAVEFVTEEDAVLDGGGSADVGVLAALPGTGGNVPAGVITLMATPLKGITGIQNPERTSGGAEEEDDEALRARVMELNAAAEASFVGCDADYVRWAQEVVGVGSAFVLPQWNPGVPNSVKVVVLDGNGEPANEKILEDVYRYIMSPEEPMERKAPIGADVTVAAPREKMIRYAFLAQIKPGRPVAAVTAQFRENMQKYYVAARTEGVLYYNRVHAVLTETEGILDFTGLTVNETTENIPLEADEYPVTESVDPGIPEEPEVEA